MTRERIKSALESLLFVWGDPLEAKTAAELFNADGERVEATNHPMMAFSFPCETPLLDGAILRKQREQN